ncbi:MAG: DUF2812 domain-containing protein [Staphylococcus simulans]|uniref:DUF2812 domain-containing protein n=1 Tax=Staphylococcus TaxID=1279 RepID=UPI0008A8EB5F|nr:MULTISPECIES: DUF2812 domain-containing protein [Staphylococcus]MDK7925961.1 DUF2812 domain-containing protein [Staphylococcus simulans]MDK8314551.1 DUF2812 domain-containing protein [Staphylococcus simulans]OHR47393.1 hypothetical protein HMPREF2951_04860 [Staphylococcus sp. HMSC056D08]OHR60534.1 hypothetical protein HMPREF2937_06230 [Staphylococcus sp. HMSC061G12]OHS48409.1 hypothetical protein HMPREF3270_01460 [Staphylococcus sp. HMSC65H10]
MKNIKFYCKGSPSEIRYLESQQQKGYVLKDIQNNIYTFEKDPEVRNTTLHVTFAKTKDLEGNSQNRSENPFLSVLAKKLFYSKYTVLYSYLKNNDDPIYSTISDTKNIEHEYLSFFKRINFTLAILTMIICVALWSYYTAIGKPSSTLIMPIQIMLIVFLITLFFSILINRRIRKSCPKLHDELYLSYSVSIKNESALPNIDSLKYLGAWRYQTEKEGKHYYSLLSKEPKETIISAIQKELNISNEHIYVYSQWDLFPIYMHF